MKSVKFPGSSCKHVEKHLVKSLMARNGKVKFVEVSSERRMLKWEDD